MAMVRPGESVYFICKGEQGKVRVKGIALEVTAEGTLVAGVDPSVIQGVPNAILFEQTGCKSVGLIKVPADSVSTVQPAGWGNQVGGVAPKMVNAKKAWEKMSGEGGLNSSETELLNPPAESSAKPKKSRLEEDLLQMSQELWDVSEEEGESSSDGEINRRKNGGKQLAPGASGSGVSKEKNKEKKHGGKEADFQKLMLRSLSSGASPTDMVPLMMMQMMMQQQQSSTKKGHRRGRNQSPGSSDSDSSEDDELGRDPGMKSVATLHRLHRRVKHHPRDIIRNFEKELTEELGVVPGQSWTTRDWVRRQPWGKFKGIYRTAIQDCAVYEMIRAGQHDSAAAQVIQNLKSKVQSVLSNGDWQTAWLLCGLQDPLQRKEFGGTKEEMSVISGYINSLHKLKKKMKESRFFLWKRGCKIQPGLRNLEVIKPEIG